MSFVSSLRNAALGEDEEIADLLSQLRLNSRTVTEASGSLPPTPSRRSQRENRPLWPALIPSLRTNSEALSAASLPLNLSPGHSRQSSDEYYDARSHQSSTDYADSSLDNTIASISAADLLALGDLGPEPRRHGESLIKSKLELFRLKFELFAIRH